MSRARQVANFDPALFAADEISGDKVSGGTIGAGVIGASVTGGAGLTGSTSLGTVTAGNLSNTAIVYPAGHVVNVARVYLTADTSLYDSSTMTNFWSPTYTPLKDTSTVHAILDLAVQINGYNISGNYLSFEYDITGTNITNRTGQYSNRVVGEYSSPSTSYWAHEVLKWSQLLIPTTPDGLGNATITYVLKIQQNNSNSPNTGWYFRGSGSTPGDKTSIMFMEVM